MKSTFCDVGFTEVGCSDVLGSDGSASASFMKRWLRCTCVVGIGGFSLMVAAPGETLAICSTKLLNTCTAASLTLICCTCAGNVFGFTTSESSNAICVLAAMIK